MTIRHLFLLGGLTGLLIGTDGKAAQTSQRESKPQMTPYVICFFKKGPNWGKTSAEESQRLREGHLANLRKIVDSGKLTVAGPITDAADDLRGMLIFHDASLEEVRGMMERDPSVKDGQLVTELHAWSATGALRVEPSK